MKISLPRVREAMENGLRDLDHQIDAMSQQIQKIQEKRDKALIEAKLQRDAVNAIIALDAELEKDNSTLTLRFPE